MADGHQNMEPVQIFPKLRIQMQMLMLGVMTSTAKRFAHLTEEYPVKKLASLLIVLYAIVGSAQTPKVHYTYELYSWRNANGGWEFSLLYATNRTKSPEEVFGDKGILRGTNAMVARIDHLSRGSMIVWMDQVAIWGNRDTGSNKFEYPPQGVVAELNKHAAARKVTIIKQ